MNLLAAFLILPLFLGQAVAPEEKRRPFSVMDAIEMSVVVSDWRDQEEVHWSPDHTRAVVVIARGNVKRNGTELRLLSCQSPCLSLTSVATLFTTSTQRLEFLLKEVRWVDDRTLAFLWDGGGALGSQLYRLDVPSRRLTQLTRHPTPVLDYDVSPDLRRIVFTAETPRDTGKIREMATKGFVVQDQGLTALLAGDLDGWQGYGTGKHHEFFIQTERDLSPRQVGADTKTWSQQPSVPVLAPNGRYAITTRTVYAPPPQWSTYADALAAADYAWQVAYLLPALNRMSGHTIVQYVVIDLDRRTIEPLVDAPLTGGYSWIKYAADGNKEARPVWSPDSKSVALGPMFLPLSSDGEAGRRGRGLAVVEVATGRIAELPVPLKPGLEYRPIRWTSDRQVLVQASDSTEIAFQRSPTGVWTQAPVPFIAQPLTFDLFVRQRLNTPPTIVRRESGSSTERTLLDLNPELKDRTLGRVELFHWRSSDGRWWTGELYHPVNQETEHRYPLVIQTHGHSEDQNRFEVNGPTATMFAAQPLANKGMMVLQLGEPDSNLATDSTPAEAAQDAAGYTSAIDALENAGLIDRARVGIIGWSYTGWTVLYTLTHPLDDNHFFAAAIVGHHMDCSYFQRIVLAGYVGMTGSNDVCSGGLPLGLGLEARLKESPGFNTDKIHTPIRFEAGDGAVDIAVSWEVFQLLRFQRKPVEMFAIPDYVHGVHLLQNPAQRLYSQGGTVDWFDFWLNDREDPDPKKAEQYDRWRELRKLQQQRMQDWKREKR